jgi:hypothetical protein
LPFLPLFGRVSGVFSLRIGDSSRFARIAVADARQDRGKSGKVRGKSGKMWQRSGTVGGKNGKVWWGAATCWRSGARLRWGAGGVFALSCRHALAPRHLCRG